MRVATKYPNAARRWFDTRGEGAELIRLHGSVELAPSAGLADGIVDVVATGTTLQANRLTEIATIGASSARLVVNVASKCGLTPQYSGLERLQERYANKGFSVVGFPCNQFAGQEPGTAGDSDVLLDDVRRGFSAVLEGRGQRR